MINLHNHTTWSDGRYPPEQLAKMATLNGLTHLGITDHFYTTKLPFRELYVDDDQLYEYVADLHRVAHLFAGQIEILAGLEVDWSSRGGSHLPNLWQHIHLLDYVLFEYVDDREWAGGSFGTLLAVRSSIPAPVGLAHNNLRQNFAPIYAPGKLVSLLEEHDIFVELNSSLAGYYEDRDPYNVLLWQALAASRVRFSVGSDTHEFIDDVGHVREAHRFLEERGLSDRLITSWWDPSRRAWHKELP